MEYGMEDFRYGMEMEWKKIASMEYGKIVFHSIPYLALIVNHRNWLDDSPPLMDFVTRIAK